MRHSSRCDPSVRCRVFQFLKGAAAETACFVIQPSLSGLVTAPIWSVRFLTPATLAATLAVARLPIAIGKSAKGPAPRDRKPTPAMAVMPPNM